MRNLLHRSLMCSSSKNYLTIESLEDGLTVSLSNNKSYYRIDNGNWNLLPADESTKEVKAGQKIQFKISNPNIKYESGIGTFKVNNKLFNVEGNIMSLLYGDEFEYYYNTLEAYSFVSLFKNCTTLKSAKKLLLPDETNESCYGYMFKGCESLIEPPVLPSVNLSTNCYFGMFEGCTSLTTAPELPATRLDVGCYNSMFKGCSKLQYIKILAKTRTTYSLYNWVDGVSNTGIFIKDFDFKLEEGINGIPLGWCYNKYDYFTIVALENDLTVSFSSSYDTYYRIDKGVWTNLNVNELTPKVNTGQKIQLKITNRSSSTDGSVGKFVVNKAFEVEGDITSLLYGDNYFQYISISDSCFEGLFKNCTTLKSAKNLILPQSISKYCYVGMFEGCSSLTTAPALPATTLAEQCYENMFKNCTSLTTAPALPATSLARNCYYRMFAFCESLSSNILLPAKTLVDSCYFQMFYRCSNVNHITMLATENLSGSLYEWVAGVSSNGTFVKDPNITLERGSSGIPQGWEIYDPNNEYFTIEALEDGLKVSLSSNDLKYRIDGGNWTTLTTNTTTREVNAGQKIQFKLVENYNIGIEQGIGTFNVNKAFNVSGNIMSLLFGDDYLNKTDLSNKDYAFYDLFLGCNTLHSAANLKLPATILSKQCYDGMFYDCTSLIYAPEKLPAKILAEAEGCYEFMFYNCKSLRATPELPALVLANYCYYCMFQDCTSLTTVPKELPAITLAECCYAGMFDSCHSLKTAPKICAENVKKECCLEMFNECRSLTTAPEKLPAITLAERCYAGMFDGCYLLTTAPELPAITLADACYEYMFYGCESLITAPELPSKSLASSCYFGMFEGCSSLTKAPDLPALKLTKHCYAYMFTNCSKLKYIKMLALKTDVSGCLSGWVSGDKDIYGNITLGVPTGGTFVKHEYNNDLEKDSVDGIPLGWSIESTTFTQQYFTIESLEDNNEISFNHISAYYVDYSLDFGKSWSTYVVNNKITIHKNECISFRSSMIPTVLGIGTFKSTKKYNTFGNIMSLLHCDEFVNKDKINNRYAFYQLFLDSDNLIDAGNLILPAKDLYESCYREMFLGCTSLTTAPVLRSETMKYDCYREMFQGCTSLITAPDLPATTLANYCYYGMFRGCTSLTTAPDLPATTLAGSCYFGMFQDCTSLTTVPEELPATTLASDCYAGMFYDCRSLITAPDLPATTLADGCYSAMFEGCSSLTTAPDLPATTLAEKCYEYMFMNCTSLTDAPALPATTLAKSCYFNMFFGCNLTSAPALPATKLADECYEYMFGCCTSLTSAPALPATTLTEYCYKHMFYNCISLVMPPYIGANELSGSYCCESMFEGCTSLIESPVLYANGLTTGCYNRMFYGCENLKEITIYGTHYKSGGGNMSSNCLNNWVYGVQTNDSTCSFYKKKKYSYNGYEYDVYIADGNNGIPIGWTVIEL